MLNPIEVLEAIGKAADAAAPIIRTIKALGPLIQQTHDYVTGKSVDLPPELPESLKSDVELARLEALASKDEG